MGEIKRPSFQFYPGDWLSDMKVRLLPFAAKGLYMDLLCFCWKEGYIPNDGSAIAQLTGCHDLAIVELCTKFFIEDENDSSKLIHKRLEQEKKRLNERKRERSESGKRGAKARWGADKKLSHKLNDSSANGSAINQPMAKNGSSTSTSTSKERKNTKKKSDDVIIPMLLQVPAFVEAWEKWKRYRTENRLKPYKPTGETEQLNRLEKMGADRAVAAISWSMAQNYQGIYEENQNGGNGNAKSQNRNVGHNREKVDYSNAKGIVRI